MPGRAILALLLAVQVPPDDGWHATGANGAVAGGGKEAVAAALEALKTGANAADAAATMLLALAVTDSDQFCFGGEVPILVYDAKTGTVEVIAGMGAAPKLATREHFAKGIPGSGIEPAAVPAALDAVLTLLERHGTLTFEQAVAPAIKLLEGKPGWQEDFRRTLQRLAAAEKTAEGDRAKQLRAVSDFFYRGPVAREIDAWSKANGGLLRYEDLAAHKTAVEKPVTADYRGHVVAKCGPWTQGPWLLEALRLLEGFNLRAMGHGSPDAVHVQVEAMKLGLADRDVHYGDPAFVDVPLEKLLSKEYAELRRPLIDLKRASREQRPGDPRGGKALLGDVERRKGLGGPANDTTTCLAADKWGNVVAATPSGWAGVVAGETGVELGSRLQSFNVWEGHPNCIAPGKRPRITLTPTLVLKDGKPVLAVSVAGGDAQDQVTLQMVTNHVDFGLAPERSVTAVRFQTHHYTGSFRQTPPQLGSLAIYREAGDATLKALADRGHDVHLSRPPIWHPCVIAIDPATGAKRAAGDPAAKRHAAAH
jgi:gamma-glutamyltranspeptidase/glutathione hydrolase